MKYPRVKLEQLPDYFRVYYDDEFVAYAKINEDISNGLWELTFLCPIPSFWLTEIQWALGYQEDIIKRNKKFNDKNS